VAAIFFALAVASLLGGCPGSTDNSIVCTGDVTITTSQEFDAFVARGCTSVSGTLTISGTDLTSVCLPRLTSVTSRVCSARGCSGGLVVAGNDGLTSLSLPALATGGVEIYGNALASLTLPALTSTGSRLEVSGDPALTTLSLPVLAASDGGLHVYNNPSLTTLSLPVLATVGTLSVWGTALTTLSLPVLATVTGDLSVSNAALTTFSLPVLVTVGGPSGLSVSDNAALTTFSLPMLATVGGRYHLYANPALTSFSLPVLATVGSLQIANNPALTSVSLPALTTASAFLGITDNTAYPQCAAEAILAQLTAAPAEVHISGNDTTATCLP
jgi:hypothetical protein